MTCIDCGQRSASLLCQACVHTAEVRGLSSDERAALLGYPPLDLDGGDAA